MSEVNLKQEQLASLNRPRYSYSLRARIFFFFMDKLTGKTTTLAKTKLIEILASIPYRTWENRQYAILTKDYDFESRVGDAQEKKDWSRAAQDNEYLHLLVINAKMKEDQIENPWFLRWGIPFVLVSGYRFFARCLTRISPRRAYLFNAEFEDHAEHVYARFVADHPEWETQPAKAEILKQYAQLPTWADVFRRIGLDERDHRNASFKLAGKMEAVVQYYDRDE